MTKTQNRTIRDSWGDDAHINRQMNWMMAQDANPNGVVGHVARMLCLMRPTVRAEFKRKMRAVLDAFDRPAIARRAVYETSGRPPQTPRSWKTR